MLLTNIRTSRRSPARRAAFTLLEVLIVVAILVILASAASISLFRYLEDAKVGKAKAEMNTILGAVKKYYTENQAWPPQNGLAQTVGPMIEGNPNLLDPWQRPYRFEVSQVQQADGTSMDRPQIIMDSPGPGKPEVRVPAQ